MPDVKASYPYTISDKRLRIRLLERCRIFSIIRIVMKEKRELRFATRQIHGGLHPGEAENARGLAIVPTAAYRFPTCEYAADLFELSQPGNIYTRLQNPTTTSYEERIASLYEGSGAVATPSGMSAIFITISALAQAGDNIVTSPFLYGGTYNLFRHSLRKLGIEVRIAGDESAATIASLCDDRTKAIFIESMGNPTCAVPDIEGIAAVAKEKDVPLVVDNTFGAGGYLCNPFKWGADIVVDSATKWINGHGTAMGGVIVDGGSFNWRNGKFPQLDGPSDGYHGLNLCDAFGNAAFAVKCRVDGLRDFGTCPSPFDSYLMCLGLETLSLRVRHQVESTERLARFCAESPCVKSVSFVGFPDHPYHDAAARYFRFGSSAVFTIELKGDLESTVKFVESLELCAHMTMIGDSITVVTHPASTTHKQLSESDLKAAGITPTLLRISLGLEDVEDIIDDFRQTFEKTGIA